MGLVPLQKGPQRAPSCLLPCEVTPRKQQQEGSELTLNVLVPRSQTPILQDGERFKSVVQELPSLWCPVPAAWDNPHPRTPFHSGRQALPLPVTGTVPCPSPFSISPGGPAGVTLGHTFRSPTPVPLSQAAVQSRYPLPGCLQPCSSSLACQPAGPLFRRLTAACALIDLPFSENRMAGGGVSVFPHLWLLLPPRFLVRCRLPTVNPLFIGLLIFLRD